MGEDQVERRLAAILAADVVGYSRLMEANEERTMGALKQHRREFFDPTMAEHGQAWRARLQGDGRRLFGSVINAASCAVEIQRGMVERNAGVPEDRQIKFRIGINVGDLIVDGDDFYGDGVNMAARLEGLASPGGIACSAAARSRWDATSNYGSRPIPTSILSAHIRAIRNCSNSPSSAGRVLPSAKEIASAFPASLQDRY